MRQTACLGAMHGVELEGGVTYNVYDYERESVVGKGSRNPQRFVWVLGGMGVGTHRLHVGSWDKATQTVRITFRFDFPPTVKWSATYRVGREGDALIVNFFDE
jgi:hypothetical protein